MNPPRVLISYSHDSAEHKEWVLKFATTIRERGIDAVLDQWDLKPGDDLPHFMETEIETADYVLMICTESYVQKANAGSGGVGFEKMIITSSYLSRIDNNKIIPIIRQNTTKEVPTFLKSKLYVDFSVDSETEYKLDELLRRLLNAPLFQKPEIGSNPFKPLDKSKTDRTSDGIKEVMTNIADCYDNSTQIYIRFQDLIKKSSMHRLTLDKYLKDVIDNDLMIWSTEYSNALLITTKGRDYLIEHGIISL